MGRTKGSKNKPKRPPKEVLLSIEQKTIILGIERNTKELEPVIRDSSRSHS